MRSCSRVGEVRLDWSYNGTELAYVVSLSKSTQNFNCWMISGEFRNPHLSLKS